MTEPLRLETENGVGRLLIDRPEKRNALTQTMWEALPVLVERAMADPSVRLLVVRSANPGAFCAGADIGEFAASAQDSDWRARNNAAIRLTQITLARAPKPTIAAIDGDCIGGGLGLALACDIRIASRKGRFGLTPAKLGLVYPLHDTKLLVDLVGPSVAKLMLYTADHFDTDTAQRLGIVTTVADDLEAGLKGLTAAILAVSSATQRAAKAIIGRILAGASDDDVASADQFDQAFTGPDFAEGVAAFLGKRKPVFG